MRSCSSSVFVQETAEQVVPLYAGSVILSDDPEASGRIWRLQSERAMRTVLVVMRHVASKDLVQVPAPDNEQPVEALGADRANPPLRVGVRVGRLHRREQNLCALGTEHVIEGAAELRITVPEQEAQPSSPLLQCQQQVAGLLGDPGAVGVGGRPSQV